MKQLLTGIVMWFRCRLEIDPIIFFVILLAYGISWLYPGTTFGNVARTVYERPTVGHFGPVSNI